MVLIFMAGSVVFGVLIQMYKNVLLVILRVVLLDGLFLVMGITLGVCIIVVSFGRRRRRSSLVIYYWKKQPLTRAHKSEWLE